MRNAIFLVLLLFARTHARKLAVCCSEKLDLVDKLVDRAINTWSLHHVQTADLQKTIVAKARLTSSLPRSMLGVTQSSFPVPGSPLANPSFSSPAPRRPDISYISHAVPPSTFFNQEEEQELPIIRSSRSPPAAVRPRTFFKQEEEEQELPIIRSSRPPPHKGQGQRPYANNDVKSISSNSRRNTNSRFDDASQNQLPYTEKNVRTRKSISKNSLDAKLKKVRQDQNITLKRPPNLRKYHIGRDGNKAPLTLRPYQKQMVVHLMHRKRFVVGDDCGLGKTIESIAALCQLWKQEPRMKALVLTKKSSIRQWEGEFHRFTKNITVFPAIGTKTQRAKAQGLWEQAKGRTVLIQGYTSAGNDINDIAPPTPERFVFILDDATVVKNPETKVHKVCRILASRASRCWGLTATLIKNNLVEGYGVFSVVKPDLFPMSMDMFMMEFCITELHNVGKYGKEVPVIVGYKPSHIEMFRDWIDDYYLGRPKHLVAKDLPVLTTRIVPCELTGFQLEKYYAALDGLLKADTEDVGGDTVFSRGGDLDSEDGEDIAGTVVSTRGGQKEKNTRGSKLASLVYCQQIVNHPALIGYPDEKSGKLETLLDMVTDGGDLYDEKVIVFTRFVEMVNTAMPVLEEAGVKCVRITGKESEEERLAAQDAFQNSKDPTRIIFITMAGGDAINLQAAKAIVFYDIPWSAGDYLQLVGRMIRIGASHENCYAIHLVCKKTIDERVQDVVRQKMKLIEQVLGERVRRGKGQGGFLKQDSEMGSIFDALVTDAQDKTLRPKKKKRTSSSKSKSKIKVTK